MKHEDNKLFEKQKACFFEEYWDATFDSPLIAYLNHCRGGNTLKLIGNAVKSGSPDPIARGFIEEPDWEFMLF